MRPSRIRIRVLSARGQSAWRLSNKTGATIKFVISCLDVMCNAAMRMQLLCPIVSPYGQRQHALSHETIRFCWRRLGVQTICVGVEMSNRKPRSNKGPNWSTWRALHLEVHPTITIRFSILLDSITPTETVSLTGGLYMA